MAIQGELIGMGIQKNNLRLPENKVLFFNVFNIDKFEYLIIKMLLPFLQFLIWKLFQLLDYFMSLMIILTILLKNQRI